MVKLPTPGDRQLSGSQATNSGNMGMLLKVIGFT